MSKTELAEGLYDLIIDQQLRGELDGLSGLQPLSEEVDPEQLTDLLALQLMGPLRRALRQTARHREGGAEAATELANTLIQTLIHETQRLGAGVEPHDAFVVPPRRLVALYREDAALGQAEPPRRPTLPLTASDLLVNGRNTLSIGSELRKELESADRVDYLCAFLRMSGLGVIRRELERFLKRRPGGLRVLTTTYTGATERRAVEALLEMGAQVRVSYNVTTTRLHAKAWLFERASGFSTAFIGSSNLSRAALFDGLEWNVRVSAKDNPAILHRFEATFEQYWDDVEFEPYDPSRFDTPQQGAGLVAEHIAGLTVRPYPHQTEILDALAAERQAGHTRNLVVAATGTGKTITAALDFKRLCEEHGERLTLLFVAHRKEILKQSCAAFRVVLGDPSFGELLVDGLQPREGAHVFASVQSLRGDRLEALDPKAYDVVIVDEFHHAAAPTYEALLEHLEPRYLVGLTATPERADGKSVLGWFEDRIAAELRLWTALDRGLLCPFQYFGVADEVDLSGVTFRRGTYDRSQLQSLLTGDSMRALRVQQAVARYVPDPGSMRALGFCVGIQHAAVMAEAFRRAGIASCAVAGSPPRTGGVIDAPFRDRDDALRALRAGELQCIFAVDLFNEGVDVPNIDTVLFLRPTDSATIFLQQLGRGLRHAEGKSHLTVLDFIGHAHRRYRFDLKFRALTGGSRRTLRHDIEEGFPSLPPGCSIVLDEVAQEHVLENIRSQVGRGELRALTAELTDAAREVGEGLTLSHFLERAELGVGDLYSSSNRTWTDLRDRASLPWPSVSGDREESALLRAMARLQHVDDRTRFERWLGWLRQDSPPAVAPVESWEGRLQLMLLAAAVDLRIAIDDREEALASIWSYPAVRRELVQLLEALEDRTRRLTWPGELADGVPLHVHGTYALAEIMAGYGITSRGHLMAPREGVRWDEASQTDLLFVTLHKSEDEFAPQTMYDDYPINQRQFHWESQSNTSEASETGQRYIHHQERGSRVVLFARHYKKRGGLTQPYVCLGNVRYARHQSERPMQIVWTLERPMPASFYLDAKVAAG